MSRSCDQPDEMPEQFLSSEDFLDDEAIEAILCGRRPAEHGLDSLVTFARDVHAVSDQPAPRPNASLAAVLSAGFSTDKGDLLVTAASNVYGPAEQAAGLPKWRKRNRMLPTGLFTGLAGKIAAGIVAGLAGVTAVGAAGALPGPAQTAVAHVINTVTPFNLPDGDTSVSISAGTNPATPGAGAGIKVDTPAGGVDAKANASTAGVNASAGAGASTPSTTAGATADAGAKASVPTPNVPNLSGLPGLSGLNGLPVPVPACVKDIIDLKTGQPKVPLNQISAQVIACVKSLMSTATASVPAGQLPAGLNQCVSSILGMLGSVGTNPGSVPSLTGVDLSKCVPIDVTKCMTSIMGMFKGFIPGGGLGFGGSAGTSGASASAGGGFGIPGLSGLDLSGCLPFNLDACLDSLLGMAGNLPGAATGGVPGLGAGTVPSNLNLSACVPFGSISSLPGMSWIGAFLPH